MRPSSSPATSPAQRTGDRPERVLPPAVLKRRKLRARRVALESLEPRALMAVAPLAPLKEVQLLESPNGLDLARVISNDSGTTPGDDSSPQIAVNRYNPNKLVAVWTARTAPAGSYPEFQVRVAYSVDAGLTWRGLNGLPGVRFDPSSGTNPHPYSRVSRASVAFDSRDNFYVLEVQQNENQVQAGDMILTPFSFTGLTPTAGAAQTVYEWDRTIDPFAEAILDVQIAVDDNLASFTDPVTGRTQTDVGTNRIYIATATEMPNPSGFPFWNPYTVDLYTSTDNGASFTINPSIGGPHAAGTPNYESNAVPRIAISQGRAPGTNGPGDAGVPGGQVTVVFNDFHSNGELVVAPVAVDVLWAARFEPQAGGVSTPRGRSQVGQTIVRGGPLLTPTFPLGTPSTPVGIGPGVVVASDNTLGLSAHSGRIYAAYVDRYDTPRGFVGAGQNPADNTDIFLKYSDNGGVSWVTAGQVNDDDGLTDGFSGAWSRATRCSSPPSRAARSTCRRSPWTRSPGRWP